MYTADKPSNPLNFMVVSQSQSAISVKWDLPLTVGGCDIEGYRLYIEELNNPGYQLIYNGIVLSSIMSYTISYPDIKPSTHYRLMLQAKNCGQFSTGTTLKVSSASKPSTIVQAPTIVSYGTTSLSISWVPPESNGGFAVS